MPVCPRDYKGSFITVFIFLEGRINSLIHHHETMNKTSRLAAKTQRENIFQLEIASSTRRNRRYIGYRNRQEAWRRRSPKPAFVSLDWSACVPLYGVVYGQVGPSSLCRRYSFLCHLNQVSRFSLPHPCSGNGLLSVFPPLALPLEFTHHPSPPPSEFWVFSEAGVVIKFSIRNHSRFPGLP